MVKPTPPNTAAPAMWRQFTFSGRLAIFQLYDNEAEQQNAHGLADEQAERTRQKKTGLAKMAPVSAPAKGNIGVREGEERQNGEVHPRVQLVLKARSGRNDQARHRREIAHVANVVFLAKHRLIGVERVFRLTNFLIGPGDEAFQVNARARRNGKCEQHASDGRMNATRENAEPQHHAQRKVRRERVHDATC